MLISELGRGGEILLTLGAELDTMVLAMDLHLKTKQSGGMVLGIPVPFFTSMCSLLECFFCL